MLLFCILLCLPFFFRYIGLFVMAPAAILVIYLYYSGRKHDFIYCGIALTFAILLCFAYFFLNFYATGYATGSPRVPAQESNLELALALAKTIILEFVLVIPAWQPGNWKQTLFVSSWVGVSFFAAWIAIRLPIKNITSSNRLKKSALIFCIFGGFYGLARAYARWNAAFDDFTLRLIDSGFSLMFIGVLLYFLSEGLFAKSVSRFVLVSIGFTFSIGPIWSTLIARTKNHIWNTSPKQKSVTRKSLMVQWLPFPNYILIIFDPT
jgi:hypothetical protein